MIGIAQTLFKTLFLFIFPHTFVTYRLRMYNLKTNGYCLSSSSSLGTVHFLWDGGKGTGGIWGGGTCQKNGFWAGVVLQKIKGTGGAWAKFWDKKTGKIAGVSYFGGGIIPLKVFWRIIMWLKLARWEVHTICKWHSTKSHQRTPYSIIMDGPF